MTTEIINSKESLASHYALQVALQTMKERCQNLQHRLTTVEEENLRLRMISGIDKPPETKIKTNDLTNKFGGQNEIELLRDKVAELSRQKIQLTEHIAMVATENRQLWSRLSKLTKDNHSLNKIKDSLQIDKTNINNVLTNTTTTISTSASSTTAANLIRSKTFTQNSPNPMLRLKLNQSQEYLNENLDYGGEDECDDINQQNKSNEFSSLNQSTTGMGFGYLPDQEIDSDATVQSIKRINEAFHDFKKEILWQQNDLKNVLIKLQKYKDHEKTKGIKEIKKLTIIKVDKCLETDPIIEKDDKIIVKPQALQRTQQHPLETQLQSDDTARSDSSIQHQEQQQQHEMELNQLLKQKNFIKSSDLLIDRMCPMCGKIFIKSIAFSEFQDHVESHFIDDCDTDYNSIERNFEIISHTVGDF